VADHILDPLDDEQRAVARAVEGPVVVWAGAGTGKTTAITHRIAYAAHIGAHDPRRTLAVTFTNRAAGQMRDRLARLGVEGVQARTFHAAALRQLRYFWPRAVGGQIPDVAGRIAPLIGEAAARVKVPSNSAVVREVIGEISWAKQSNTLADGYPARAKKFRRDTALEAADIAGVFAAYEDIKSERGVIDFDDVLLLTVAILDDRPDIADEIRTTYRHFTVDEFQDVSAVQDRLLRLWLGERDDVCVVGDPAQTIYTFAGADDAYLRSFSNRFSSATQVRLVRNYRSGTPIVEVANSVLAQLDSPSGKLLPTREGGVRPEVSSYPDEPAEAAGIADQVRELIRSGTSPGDIAVLVRINANLPALEESFAERGLPVIVRGGERFFDRGEVREAITRLRGAARSGESHEGALPDQVAAVLAIMGFTPQPPRGTGPVRQRWESLASLHALATTMAADSDLDALSDLSALVAELDRRQSAQHAPTADAVTLTTVHAAKGLEWDVVFVAGMNEGNFPHGQAESPAALAEERRLFYVALTRARDRLVVTWARARQPGGRERRPSRFLDEAFPDASRDAPTRATGRAAGAGRTRRRGPASCRVCAKALVTPAERARGRCRTCPGSADEAVIEALKAWRLTESRERAVPAYVVLTDATVEALAEVRPQDADGLGAISGIGPDKLTRYGDTLLALIRESELPRES
jgi:DNA helicase-2/ATP-dependent DNA helicase PcrA